jgi:hypothetical protein
MTDDNAAGTTTETATTDAETTPTGTDQEVDFKAEAEKWKALSRQNEATAKANAEKAKQFDALEEANKTEQQRLNDRVAAAEAALAQKVLEADRASVALEKGLTASQAKRLVGSDRDELAADAEQLLADLGKTTGPRSDLSQGPKARAGEQSPAEQFADLIRKQTGR